MSEVWPPPGETFVCDTCGVVSPTGRSREETLAEYRENFGPDEPFSKENCLRICDDCYEGFMAWFQKRQ